MTQEAGTAAPARVLSLLRDVPDFPVPGVMFKDITPVLADHEAFSQLVAALAAPFSARSVVGPAAPGPVVDVVAGIEARGFLLGAPLALALNAGFVPVRKAGKLPAATFRTSYALEYGTAEIELHRDAIRPGERVLVVDDVLATGGTAAAAVALVRRAGGTVVGVRVLLELLALHGRDRLPGVAVTALLSS